MALTKITYDDKETLINLPGVANKNKCTSADMNEIKTIVNDAIDQVDTNTSNISNLIKTGTQTINVGTVNAGGVKYNQTYTLANIPSGYKFVGILGWNFQGSGFTDCFISQLIKDTDTTIKWGIKSTLTYQTTLTLDVDVLYIKSS